MYEWFKTPQRDFAAIRLDESDDVEHTGQQTASVKVFDAYIKARFTRREGGVHIRRQSPLIYGDVRTTIYRYADLPGLTTLHLHLESDCDALIRIAAHKNRQLKHVPR